MITPCPGYRVAMRLRTVFGVIAGVVVAGIIAPGLGGCASSAGDPSPPGGAAGGLVTEPFAPVLLDTPPAPMRADGASVEVVRRVELLDWEGDGARDRRRMVVERSGPEPGQTTWQVTRTLLERVGGGADEATPVRTDSYTLTPEGAVAISEENNHDEKVEVVFEPAMVVMPLELVHGTPAEQKFNVKVYPGGKGRKTLKSSGSATQTIELTGMWLVTLAGGEQVQARGVRSVFRADFDPAKVVNTTEQWFVDGVGVVAEQRHERTTVFGLPIRESSERWVARGVAQAMP